MRKLYLILILLGGIVGCHQEPAIPASGIPTTCQVFSVANVNEATHDTTYYQYTPFGHVSESLYRQWINNQLTVSTRQQFTYSADHYLMTQAEQMVTNSANGNQTQLTKMYTYAYGDGQLQQVTILDAQSRAPLGYKLYTYEDGTLKTYVETNAQKVPIRSYSFDGSGKLLTLTEPGSTIQVDKSTGKIIQRVGADGTNVTYQFDGQGQLVNERTVFATSQSERTYTYDKNPYWNKTQLLFRGIPTPDLGGVTLAHNIATSGFRLTQNGRVVQDLTFTYQYQFNKANYSLGYSRSDGFRQRISYANCL